MKFSTTNQTFLSAVIALCIMLVFVSAAQSAGSFSDLDIEYSEVRLTLEKLTEENRQLRAALADTQKTLAEMRKGLLASNGEAAVFQSQSVQMKLRMDALGLGSASGSGEKLEQRLLAAVSDLRTVTAEKKSLSGVLIRLCEAASLYARTAAGAPPQARLTLETEIRGANAILASASSADVQPAAANAPLGDSTVISVEPGLALVVMNFGSKQGVKVGTPFQIVRSNKTIGSVRVVDVRDTIAGAVIQNLSSEKEQIKVGDRLQVIAQQ